jgi:hypothetical protein
MTADKDQRQFAKQQAAIEAAHARRVVAKREKDSKKDSDAKKGDKK